VSAAASSRLIWDGRRLATDRGASGRRVRADPRCLAGRPVHGAWAHVCALADAAARVPFDFTEVQQARRDALAWWIDLLGDSLVCLTTLAADPVHYAGAVRSRGIPRPSPPIPSRGSSRARSSRPTSSAPFRRPPGRRSSATAASPGPAVRSPGDRAGPRGEGGSR
jgi:hypothetical protein